MTFRDGIISAFQPRFDAISKDCDRYADALIACVEAGEIQRAEYFTLNGKGSLWISFEYINAGLLDAVETDLIKGETSRDIYGPLHENTRLTLERLVEIGAHQRVTHVYRAAIEHRIKALTSERAMLRKARKAGRNASSDWIRHYLPSLRQMVQDYETLLQRLNLTDPALEQHKAAVQAQVGR